MPRTRELDQINIRLLLYVLELAYTRENGLEAERLFPLLLKMNCTL